MNKLRNRKKLQTGTKHGIGKIVNTFQDVSYLGEFRNGFIEGYGIMRNTQNQTLTKGFWKRSGLGLHRYGEITDFMAN